MAEPARSPIVTDPTDPDVRGQIVETVRRFVANEVIPVASDMEHADRFPAEIVDQMRDLGLFGVTIPEPYGGLGLDLLTYIGVIEELAYGWMSLTGIVNTHTMAATLIMAHGNEDQKERWLPVLATGERRGALSLSEPDAGSDTRNLSCRATARRRRVRGQRHQGLGHQRRACRAGRPGRPHRGGHLGLHRGEGAGAHVRGHLGEQDTSASSATGASRRWR